MKIETKNYNKFLKEIKMEHYDFNRTISSWLADEFKVWDYRVKYEYQENGIKFKIIDYKNHFTHTKELSYDEIKNIIKA